MGTTIRRQPLSFPIPASPDYKFLNITNFGGLNVSSNPFVVSSNTASDCLNVYVDEDNALSTRPRLQMKYDLAEITGITSVEHNVIGVYALHNGYLLHAQTREDGCLMYLCKEDPLNGIYKHIRITGSIPRTKCKVFEQNDVIYLLTGEGYKNIINNHISDVEGYVPTTTIGRFKPVKTKDESGAESTTIDPDGVPYESRNLLTDKYKETFFWDGESDVNAPSNTISFENGYYVKSDVLKNYNVLKYYPDNTFLFTKRNGNRHEVYIGEVSKDFMSIVEYNLLTTFIDYETINNVDYYSTLSIPTTTDNKIFIVYEPYPSYKTAEEKVANGMFMVYHIDSNFKLKTYGGSADLLGAGYKINAWGKTYDCSEDAKYVWSSPSAYWRADSTSQTPRPYSHVAMSSSIESDGRSGYKMVISEIGDIAYLIRCDISDYTNPILYYYENISNYKQGDPLKYIFWDDGIYNIDAQRILFLPQGKGVLYRSSVYDKYDTRAVIHLKDNNFKATPFAYTRSGELANWVIDYSNPNKLYYNTSVDGLNYIKDFEDVENHYRLPFPEMPNVIQIYLKNVIVLKSENEYSLMYYKSSNEAELKLTLSSVKNDEDSKLKMIFDESKLIERFDNNTWFAAKNYTFHTQYNDPTYVPLSSYNDLGEDSENITGLSIVNDNVLAAYKRNKMYIITPITVGDELTYSYTETKNVIGNDVPDAPILTTLTEMPTIVSYDGIFALNQLENVQSSDRITTLISENINPRWLKENRDDVRYCVTLNRLYWTYYIIPHYVKTRQDPNEYSKIYLLDNRTQQWFYWEIPITVSAGVVRDNKTHLFDGDGKIFTLETSDLINEHNPDVTEYYDKVNDEKLIIPWRWISQILSLNTINYSKKLVDTTFILTDTDTQDEYALDYSFKAWRKSVSETNATTISNNIHYVQSTTKRTMIPRFNFIQIRLNNTEEDLDNNKLRLVGLGLKYVLLEGLY